MASKPTLKDILPQLQSWCAVNNISVQSVYDACHGMTLQELVYYLFGVVKQSSEEVVDYENQFSDLKEFVDNYFNNLDVQDEINKKLDEMYKDGELSELITQLFSFPNLTSELKAGNKKIAFLGDSIANGYGWWTNKKTDDNDGILAIWRKKFPNNTYENHAVNRTTICSSYSDTPNLHDQITELTSNDYDYIFLICGINDISVCITTEENRQYFGIDDSYWYNQNITGDYSTTMKGLASAINELYTKCPNGKVYYIIPPTTSYNLQIYQELFNKLAYTATAYNALVVNLQSMFRNYETTEGKKYLYDQVHPNQLGYSMMETFIINAEQSTWQLTDGSTSVLITDGSISISQTYELYDVINRIREWLNKIVPSLLKTYYADSYFVLSADGLSMFVDIQHSYNHGYLFKIYLPDMNGLILKFVYSKTVSDTLLMGIENYNAQYTYSGGITDYGSIKTTGLYMLNPTSNPEFTTWGFTKTPFVQCVVDVSYYQWGEDKSYLPEIRYTFTQTGNALMVVVTVTTRYNSITGTIDTVKNVVKYTGETVS